MVSVVALLLAFISASFVFLSRYVRRGSKLPPGNMGWPLIGETLSFIKPHPTNARGEFMERRLSRFGRIFSSHLLGNQTVVSADAELNRFIVKHDATMFEQGWPRAIKKLLGESALILLVGDAHKAVRSIFMGFLSSERLRTVFLEDSERLASSLLSSWKDSVISAKDEANKFSFYIMVKELVNIEPGNPKLEILRREYEAYMKGLASLPLYIPGTAYWKAFKSRANIVKFFEQTTEERIWKKSDGNAEVESNDDFLSWLMTNTDYSVEQTSVLLLHVLLAGHDTTGRAIFLMIYYLEGCPKSIEQLREEHRQIIKEKRGERKLTLDDYKAMDFTNSVINETLRLGNIATYLQKTAIVDVQYKGYVIPRGCSVMAHTGAVHLDPTIFEDPTCFNPWRWMGASGVKKANDFMPFGGGARLCPGQDLARLEMAVFLHHLILKYEWELVEPDHPMCLPLIDFPKGLRIRVRAIDEVSY